MSQNNPKTPKTPRNSENLENTNPLKTLHKKLTLQKYLLEKDQREVHAECEAMKIRVQDLLAKRSELLVQKREDDEERKKWAQ